MGGSWKLILKEKNIRELPNETHAGFRASGEEEGSAVQYGFNGRMHRLTPLKLFGAIDNERRV